MSTLLVLGDSVTWGQGLEERHKFSSLFLTRLQATNPTLVSSVLAHSGAIIGRGSNVVAKSQPGEVPRSAPTILQQLAAFDGDAAEVTTVLVNGGINDVDIHRLLNPALPQKALDAATERACYTDLTELLQEVGAAFPNARGYVVGYYPILSYQSDPLGIEAFFAAVHAVAFQPLVDGTVLKNALVDHCLAFWKRSREYMTAAVNDANPALGRNAFTYVDPGFDESNAGFAPNALLWGVDPDPLTGFRPKDEVAGPRQVACQNAGLSPLDFFTCVRASAGHPNVAGAAQIAARLAAAIAP